MFYHHDINGADLPLGTISLTYDDGPGKDTIRLARYLGDEQVRARFLSWVSTFRGIPPRWKRCASAAI